MKAEFGLPDEREEGTETIRKNDGAEKRSDSGYLDRVVAVLPSFLLR